MRVANSYALPYPLPSLARRASVRNRNAPPQKTPRARRPSADFDRHDQLAKDLATGSRVYERQRNTRVNHLATPVEGPSRVHFVLLHAPNPPLLESRIQPAPQRPPKNGPPAPRVRTSRVEKWRGGSRTPFPLPAHRTGRADFPHPALGQDAGVRVRGLEVGVARFSRPNRWVRCWSGNRSLPRP